MDRHPNIEEIYPLTPSQEGILFDALAAEEDRLHIEQLAWRTSRPLDRAAFEAAWRRVIDRHPILRTAFAWRDLEKPVQVVLRDVPLPVEWFSESSGRAGPPRVLDQLLQEERQRGLSMERAPVMRLIVEAESSGGPLVVWTFHHILLDGWSVALVRDEFLACYQALLLGRDCPLKPAKPFRDFVAWCESQDRGAAERFWREQLHSLSQPNPLCQEQPGGRSGFESQPFGYTTGRLGHAHSESLRATARRLRVTLSTLLEGAWALLLSSYNGEKDIAFGATVSGRAPEIPGVETVVGMLVNTIPVRVRVPPEAELGHWLRELQARAVERQAWEFCSAGQIHQYSGLPAATALYESLVVFENFPRSPAAVSQPGNLTLERVAAAGSQTRHSLTLLVVPSEELGLRFVFDRRRFDEPTADRIRDDLLAVLEAMVGDDARPLADLLERAAGPDRVRFVPGPSRTELAARSEPEQPETEMERAIAEVWCAVLGIESVGVYDNFFDLGGHSLLLADVAARLEERLGTRVGLGELVSQSLGQLAAQCGERVTAKEQQARPSVAERLRTLVRGTRLDR